MKDRILVLTAVALAGTAAWFLMHNRNPKPSASGTAAPQNITTLAETSTESAPPAKPVPAPAEKELPAPVSKPMVSTPAVAPTSAPGTIVSPTYQQTLESLVSPQVAYVQKQAAWQQLKDSGKLDQFITDVEQRVVANPNAPEFPATLGQAYLQKAGLINDLREQGILGMKADQSFEAALNLDPSNWEARFWKATAMSYWPPQLGKGREVIENFLELLKQQEATSPQPQFAQTYLRLGEQYQKEGYPDYAKQTWERGLALYSQDQQLRQKLNGPTPARQASN